MKLRDCFEKPFETWCSINGVYHDKVRVYADLDGDTAEATSVFVGDTDRLDDMLQTEVEELDERLFAYGVERLEDHQTARDDAREALAKEDIRAY